MGFQFRKYPPPAVRPRVVESGHGESPPLLVEEVIERFLLRGTTGSVSIGGPRRSGKTTALRALDLKLGDHSNLRLLDEPDAEEVIAARHASLVVYAATRKLGVGDVAHLVLAPWSRDEVIEYLLARHKERCASVMKRLARPNSGAEQCDSPDIWTIVLETLAADEELRDVKAAIERHLDLRMSEEGVRAAARTFCRRALIDHPIGRHLDDVIELRTFLLATGQMPLLEHHCVRLTLAAESIVESLELSHRSDFHAPCFGTDLIARTAGLLARNEAANRNLRALAGEGERTIEANVFSLLHAVDPAAVLAAFDALRTRSLPFPNLRRAHLPSVRWAKLCAAEPCLVGADLHDADFSESNIEAPYADWVKLDGANLRGIRWTRLRATDASFVGADLTGAVLNSASLACTDLRRATLRAAKLCDANLRAASLEGADCEGADFAGANLTEAQVSAARFVRANFRGSGLRGLRLREAQLEGACFAGAHLQGCDLEHVVLPGADFTGAKLSSALMTSSSMRGASFWRADLRRAGLADVDWEGANLRDADLSNATFHLGSSRSGLVFHAAPMEGSRTGFYNDEFREREFKSPEAVRKANLRAVDLRGANIEKCDFYLVDVRDARCTPTQREHLIRCGAILGDSVGET